MSQDSVVALAPLRWNLVRLSREWDSRLSTQVAAATRERTALIKEQGKEMARYKKEAKKAHKPAKARVPLNKRLDMMQRSYKNLRHAGQKERAASLKRRLDPMVKSFYKKELAKHITKAKKDRAEVKNKLRTTQARANVEAEKKLEKMKAEKDTALKVMRRGNKRSSDDPFSLHFAAIHGEITCLNVPLERKAIRLTT